MNRTPKQIEQAFALACRAHTGQVRRFGGDPYIVHPVAVALALLPDERLAAVGLLHDVLEDCPGAAIVERTLRFEDLAVELDEDQVRALEALTRRGDEVYADFIGRVVGDALARQVKLADIEHNLAGLPEGSLRRRYERARERLLSAG